MTDRTNKQLFVKSLMVHKDIQTPAVNHGKAYESIAVKKHEEKTTIKHKSAAYLCLSSTQCYARHLIELLIKM